VRTPAEGTLPIHVLEGVATTSLLLLDLANGRREQGRGQESYAVSRDQTRAW
jgi:hypothetical protein